MSGRDPGLFRPWRQDDRPIWQVTAEWTTKGPHSDDDVGLLVKTLDQTGMVQRAAVEASRGRLTAGLYLKASGQEAAELIGVRIVEVAHHAAGLGALGINLPAVPSATSRPPRPIRDEFLYDFKQQPRTRMGAGAGAIGGLRAGAGAPVLGPATPRPSPANRMRSQRGERLHGPPSDDGGRQASAGHAVTHRQAIVYLTVTTVLSLAAAVAVLTAAARPIQLAAVFASTAANIATALRVERSIEQTRRQRDH